MNESIICDDRDDRAEDRIGRIAQEIAQDHGLLDREWECEDQRRECLAGLVRQADVGDERDAAYLRELLEELAAPAANR